MVAEQVPGGMPAGWYRDRDPSKMRWWDGADWTERVKESVPVRMRVVTDQPVMGDWLHERNRIAVVALVVAVIGVAVIPLVPLTLVPMWAGASAVLVAGILALVLATVATARARSIGRGFAPAVIAVVLGVLLMLIALGAAAMVIVPALQA
ncbi:DUF2510 domain-containing protein [Glutamicibacter protophormiae]|uniref:DUF2510 domain-containing protein n=1 Tax=Glutamicibacter protophormiae TaxID=37930 RepID=UPI003A919CDF